MSILYDKTCFIKDVKPPRATTSKRPMTNNAVSEGTIQALSRFCARGLIVGVCLNRHKNRCSRCFFFRWNIVRDQNLHIADIAHHEARDAHQQRHAAKQHKHESHAGTMADTDQWTKHSCQDSSSHHPWLEYEVGHGAGMALMFVLFGGVALLVSVASFMVRDIRDVEILIPDYVPPEEETSGAAIFVPVEANADN